MQKCIIIIFGATGIGKTDFAHEVAQEISGEIINADVGQFYTPLQIGTAKPDWRNSPILQHLFDSIDSPTDINVAHYRQQVLQTCQKIWKKDKIPLIVGGSGFYLRSLFFAPHAQTGNSSKDESASYTWEQLYQIDPKRAQAIHPHDHYRIARAMEIYQTTGKKPSEYVPEYAPIAPFCFVYLTRDRPDLYARINQRTEQMMAQGWLHEVQQLQGTEWVPFLKKKKLIGYDDILDFLEHKGMGSDQDLIAIIRQKTRNYAKRQITFGNQLYKSLHEAIALYQDAKSNCVQFNLTEGNCVHYKKQLLEIVNRMQCFKNGGSLL